MRKRILTALLACVAIASTGAPTFAMMHKEEQQSKKVEDTSCFRSVIKGFNECMSSLSGSTMLVGSCRYYGSQYVCPMLKRLQDEKCGGFKEKGEVLKAIADISKRVIGQDQALEDIKKILVSDILYFQDQESKNIKKNEERKETCSIVNLLIKAFLPKSVEQEKETKGHVIYMVGPSGVGKSTMAREVAKALLNDSSISMLEIDSSFIDQKSTTSIANQLFQLPAEDNIYYPKENKNPMVHKSQANIIQHIESHPKSVIIINEYDKFFDESSDEALRHIVDTGNIKLSDGSTLDCSNVLFIMTSNEDKLCVTNSTKSNAKNSDNKSIKNKDAEADGTTYREHDPSLLGRFNVVELKALSKENMNQIVESVIKSEIVEAEKKLNCKIELPKSISQNIANVLIDYNGGGRTAENMIQKPFRVAVTEQELKSGDKSKVSSGRYVLKLVIKEDENKNKKFEFNFNEKTENQIGSLPFNCIEDKTESKVEATMDQGQNNIKQENLKGKKGTQAYKIQTQHHLMISNQDLVNHEEETISTVSDTDTVNEKNVKIGMNRISDIENGLNTYEDVK